MNLHEIAENNLIALSENAYPGRGLVMGCTENDGVVQICWTMGRSALSRNRVFSQDPNDPTRVFTEPADPDAMEGQDTSNIIYTAMREQAESGIYIASNGRQTDTALEALALREAVSLNRALATETYEPDAPNNTPRITAFYNNWEKVMEFSILRKPLWGTGCERLSYSYNELTPGFGLYISTYMEDGNPLPSFQGEPLLIPLTGTPEKIVDRMWEILADANKVSLAAKFIRKEEPSQVIIRNKYERVV